MQEKSSTILSLLHVLPPLHALICFLWVLEMHSADCQPPHLGSWQTPLEEQSGVHEGHPEEVHAGVHDDVNPSGHVDVCCGQTAVPVDDWDVDGLFDDSHGLLVAEQVLVWV